MYSIRNIKSVRRFSSLARIPSVRKFSIIENSSVKSGINILPVYKNGRRINIEVTQTKMEDKYCPKVNSKLDSELWFTRDKAFIKYLASIHLQSKDKEAISSARLLAYFITKKIKPAGEITEDDAFEDTIEDTINEGVLNDEVINPDVLNGVARALSHILQFMKKNSRKIHEDKSLVFKAGTLYCKGNRDISQVLDYVNFGKNVRTLLITKDVSGIKNQSSLEVQDSLALDIGHSSFHFVNDQLNYRYESCHPIVILAENLDEYLAKSVLQQLEGLANGMVFVSKDVDSSVRDLLLAKKKESGLAISVVDLSEEENESSESFEILKNNLIDLGEQPSDGDYHIKTWDRVVMDDMSTFFIDRKLQAPSDGSNSEYFQELVEVNLRSPDETWWHEIKNQLLDANNNLEDSLIDGILPEFNSILRLANEDLKEFYSDNVDIQAGLETVQESIDSFLEAIEEGNEESLSSVGKAFEKSISECTFIPEKKAAEAITDIWSICSYLISQKEQDAQTRHY